MDAISCVESLPSRSAGGIASQTLRTISQAFHEADETNRRELLMATVAGIDLHFKRVTGKAHKSEFTHGVVRLRGEHLQACTTIPI